MEKIQGLYFWMNHKFYFLSGVYSELNKNMSSLFRYKEMYLGEKIFTLNTIYGNITLPLILWAHAIELDYSLNPIMENGNIISLLLEAYCSNGKISWTINPNGYAYPMHINVKKSDEKCMKINQLVLKCFEKEYGVNLCSAIPRVGNGYVTSNTLLEYCKKYQSLPMFADLHNRGFGEVLETFCDCTPAIVKKRMKSFEEDAAGKTIADIPDYILNDKSFNEYLIRLYFKYGITADDLKLYKKSFSASCKKSGFDIFEDVMSHMGQSFSIHEVLIAFSGISMKYIQDYMRRIERYCIDWNTVKQFALNAQAPHNLGAWNAFITDASKRMVSDSFDKAYILSSCFPKQFIIGEHEFGAYVIKTDAERDLWYSAGVVLRQGQYCYYSIYHADTFIIIDCNNKTFSVYKKNKSSLGNHYLDKSEWSHEATNIKKQLLEQGMMLFLNKTFFIPYLKSRSLFGGAM